MHINDARKILKNKIIGVTCNNSFKKAKEAFKNKADYIAIGAFFSTKNASEPVFLLDEKLSCTVAQPFKNIAEIINMKKSFKNLIFICLSNLIFEIHY